MYETHICPKCKNQVNILCDGRILKEYEWCNDCKDEHGYKDWTLRWFNHRFQLFTRRDIIVRDGSICYVCKKWIDPTSRDLTIDHVIPLARGGYSSYENMKVCCNSCNNAKGDLLLEEYLSFLEDEDAEE